MPIVLKSGSLNLLELSGPVQACNGIALPLPVPSARRHNPELRSVIPTAVGTWILSSQIFDHHEAQYYLAVNTNLKYHFHVTSNYRANKNKLFMAQILILAAKVSDVLLSARLRHCKHQHTPAAIL